MNRGTNLFEGLQRVLAKLRTLRDSCTGIARTRRYPPDFITWFEGAAAICDEALTYVQEVIRRLEKCRK